MVSDHHFCPLHFRYITFSVYLGPLISPYRSTSLSAPVTWRLDLVFVGTWCWCRGTCQRWGVEEQSRERERERDDRRSQGMGRKEGRNIRGMGARWHGRKVSPWRGVEKNRHPALKTSEKSVLVPTLFLSCYSVFMARDFYYHISFISSVLPFSRIFFSVLRERKEKKITVRIAFRQHSVLMAFFPSVS